MALIAFAIPLAAGIIYPIGVLLSPAVGAVLMSLSTVIVAVNAKPLSCNLPSLPYPSSSPEREELKARAELLARSRSMESPSGFLLPLSF